jgi:cell wall-associated NlpC family hydrolase
MQQSKLQRDEFIAAARELIGVPWVHMGQTKLGVDCVGLVVYSGKMCGAFPQDYTIPEYPMGPARTKMLRHLEYICQRTMEPTVGDVVVFIKKNLAHVGILTEHNNMIHASQGDKRVLEVPFTSPWADYPHSFWELK